MGSFLAGGVVVLHIAYLAYQMCGGMLALRDGRWLPPHVLAVTWGITIVAMGWRCPLTRLEKSLRAGAGETPYDGSFLDHYVFGTYLPDGSQPVVYGLHLAFIVAVYVLLVRQAMQSRRHPVAAS
jgi:hypothetical protein